MEYRETETDTAETVKNTTVTRDTQTQEAPTSYLGIGLAMLLATATFFSGMHLGGHVEQQASIFSFFTQEKTQADNSIDLSEFWEVWNLLEDRYVSGGTSTPVTIEERIQGAIGGLVDSYGDPYTIYLPPEEASLFEEDISGNFGGVGMEVGMRDGLVTVIAPLPESPAEKAGVIAGDVIIKIDDVTTEGMNTDEAVRLIRGERGTGVNLTLYREGVEEFIELTIIRDTISIPTSKVEKRGDVFIISLYSFNALSEAEMQQALRSYVESGAKRLVIDLRGNPGGYLESAVSIASYFLPLGKVVVREDFGEGVDEQLYRSSGKELGSFAPEKLVVLVDGGSASASEILAGALQEHGVATLIGEQTFGKGSVQELIDLPDGSSLKVTIARWLTPNGNSISEGGLIPDIVVPRTVADREADKDPQLDAALEFLGKK